LEEETMPYSELLIKPMREDLTRLGVEETRRPEDVDAAVQKSQNEESTLMVIVNSVCGCAAGKARPGIALALKHGAKPDRSVTVFAGADIEATERARSYFTGYPPSSPSIGLLQNGKLVFMMERYQIEGRSAEEIAKELTRAFDKFCAPASQTAAVGD
jgi:putative YphP/YqiW family bacilliredoxin